MNAVTAEGIMRQSRGEPASQAAGIEQTRAIAEVQAAITVAQRCPRDEAIAIRRAMESCSTYEVAESAFYKFSRAGQTVSDASIHLAVELARCWGNISYGIMELSRDDVGKMSEMLAFAWDMETNTQSRMTFLVPHVRDTRQGPKVIVDMRDIYENNANNGARRLRECIFRVLPPSLKEQAKQRCYDTLEKGKGEMPLSARIALVIETFAKEGIGVDRIEAKIGPTSKWTAADVASLGVSLRSIKRQEVSADDEFPRVGTQETAAKVQQISNQQKEAAKPADDGEKAAIPEDHPVFALTNKLLAMINDAKGGVELSMVDGEIATHRDAIEAIAPEIMVRIDAAYDAADRRINNGRND